ncbi:putative glycosyltransferase [Dorcoceras hygrometricum]|uniref:Putative glycosyltransferase n=1 Tax=Dorcoceras hygrometricum TaxID=472368 RepID=A0A2Z6ZWN4_9LAMI|nr:putative glycosyltransferase [Dorcoceras hygrometricum]
MNLAGTVFEKLKNFARCLSQGGAIPLVLEHLKARAPETDLFGPQCPTSPLLPPRKVPLEDLIYTSCTDPIPQPAAARTPRLYQPSAVHSELV